MMHRSHRLFFLLGLILLFSVSFLFIYYQARYKPLPPKPPVASYRIPPSDSISFANTFLYDFDNFPQKDLLSSDKAHSGKYSVKVKGKNEFSLLIQKPVSELQFPQFKEAELGAWVYSDAGKIRGNLMFQIVDKENSLKYSFAITLDDATPENKWFYMSGKALPNSYQSAQGDIIKVYYWNICPNEVYLDDVILVFGRQQTKGNKPLLDATPKGFQFIKQNNRPPYPDFFADKITSVQTIYSQDGKKKLYIDIDDRLLPGYFIPLANHAEQILVLRKAQPCAMIWYNPEKQEFSFRAVDLKIDYELDLLDDLWVSADINGDGTDELIHSPKSSGALFVYGFNRTTQKAELISNQFLKDNIRIWQLMRFSGNNAKKSSLLDVDMEGRVFILNFEKNQWEIKSLGQIKEAGPIFQSKNKIITGNFYEPGVVNILLLYHLDNSPRYYYKLYEVDPSGGKNSCILQGNFNNKCDTLYPENTYFAYDVDGNGTDELISYGSPWRFDMKLIAFTDQGYNILGNIGFHGYEKDHNPKYYENLMLTAGYFTGNKTLDFFTVCRNKTPVPDLPDAISTYSFNFPNPNAAAAK
jgi:hypothetical protein